MSERELLPCPLCGSVDMFYDEPIVTCANSRCQASASLAAWNRRAAPEHAAPQLPHGVCHADDPNSEANPTNRDYQEITGPALEGREKGALSVSDNDE